MTIYCCVQVVIRQNLPALRLHRKVLTSYFDLQKNDKPWEQLIAAGFGVKRRKT